MAIYQHVQRSSIIVKMTLVFGVAVLVWGVTVNQRDVWVVLGFLGLVMLVAAWIFSSLTTEVTDEALSWHFGPGLWHHRIQRSDIVKAEPIRTKWWYGWGIRYTPKGWLFNISGLDAVAVSRRNGRTTLIGTDRPAELVAALGFQVAQP